jgi:hypothetical protein
MPNDPGFMIPLNEQDYFFPNEGGQRNICNLANQNEYTHAPWWTCENIQLTGTVDAVTARVGDKVVIQIGIQGLTNNDGTTSEALIQHVQAWVCYPNTVTGAANATLVVPSMQNSAFASFTNTSASAPEVFGGGDYQDQSEVGFKWISLTPWMPTEEDFLEQTGNEGHCCVIANAAGVSAVLDPDNPESGEPVGVNITDKSQLQGDIDICTDLYQGQRNIVIVPVQQGGQIRAGFGFLSGLPNEKRAMKMTVTATAIDQGAQIDPILLKVLSNGPYAGLPLKPASSPPKSLRLTRHQYKWNSWLCKIIREAEAIVEELLGLEIHPFGGGHQLRLSLPSQGLQPLSIAVELDPNEPPGTVHSLEITQTSADGARGGIRAGIVVT